MVYSILYHSDVYGAAGHLGGKVTTQGHFEADKRQVEKGIRVLTVNAR